MTDCAGWIVRSAAGRDKGTLLCVVGVEEQEPHRLLVADGKRRRSAAPKAKKRGHVDIVCPGTFRHPVIRKLQAGIPVSDRELRRALAAFRDQGGNDTWQKVI